MLEDEFAVALAIQLEVGDLLDILLINDAKLARHSVILALVNVQYVGGLSVRIPLVLRQSHKWSGLTTVLVVVSLGRQRRWIDCQIPRVLLLARITRILLLQLQVSQIKLYAHQLLRPLMQVEVNYSSVCVLRIVQDRQVQGHSVQPLMILVSN